MKKIRLVEACLKIGSGATPRGGKNVYCEKGISLIRSQNVLDFDFSENGLVYINEEQASKLNNVEVMEGDVLLNITGDSVARATIMKSDFLPARVNQHVAIIRAKKEIIDPLYLLYFLQHQKSYLLQLASAGATRNALTKSMIAGIELELPSLDIQRKIVSILNDIQEKILENKKINENLEKQAQTIFENMFPDVFSLNTDDTIQDLIIFANGKKRPKSIGNIPVYGGNGILAYTDKSNADNCVIIGRVGAYCGNTCLCIGKCWTSDNAIQAKSRTSSSPLFIYYLLRNASLPSRHIGTGQPLMTQGILNAIPIKRPSEEKISAFIKICTPVHKMISVNQQQNKSLASMRDSLLPKLISGEIEISELVL